MNNIALNIRILCVHIGQYMAVEMNKIQHFTTTSINLTRNNIYPVISLKKNLLKLEKLIYWVFLKLRVLTFEEEERGVVLWRGIKGTSKI